MSDLRHPQCLPLSQLPTPIEPETSLMRKRTKWQSLFAVEEDLELLPSVLFQSEQELALAPGLAVEALKSMPCFQVSAIWSRPLCPFQEPLAFRHERKPREEPACSHTRASGPDSRHDEGRPLLALPPAPSCTLFAQEACASPCVSSCIFGAWTPQKSNTSQCAKVCAAALGRQMVQAGASKRGKRQLAKCSLTGARWRLSAARLSALQHKVISCACP